MGVIINGCTTYSILAHSLLSQVDIPSKVIRFEMEEGSGAHTVLKYRKEKGEWRRCDPKWQKGIEKGEEIFFKENPGLKEKFEREDGPLLHGGRLEKDEEGEIIYNAEGNPKQLEYDGEKVIRF